MSEVHEAGSRRARQVWCTWAHLLPAAFSCSITRAAAACRASFATASTLRMRVMSAPAGLAARAAIGTHTQAGHAPPGIIRAEPQAPRPGTGKRASGTLGGCSWSVLRLAPHTPRNTLAAACSTPSCRQGRQHWGWGAHLFFTFLPAVRSLRYVASTLGLMASRR